MNKKYGIFPEPGTVQFERLLPGPPKRIWDYLTKSEFKAKWLSAGDVEPHVGGKVEFNLNTVTFPNQTILFPKNINICRTGPGLKAK
jgi:uncharacterized protein YndB with AHSA1/START domain